MATTPSLKSPDKAACEAIPPFVDARGTIQPILDSQMGGCALITSKAGAIRANHYHQSDWHYSYVISGKIKYFHRPVGSDEKPTTEIFETGSVFYSPPMVEHAMEFLEDTTFIVVSKHSRDKDDYEEDVIRVPDLTIL
ncbi:hypothetical protein [Labrenzia sp. R5_0]|jgi:quercetin dioxygenase-like cupin family protein|uniref:polysaccharide biosynthesis C-terminal domain-containing protein n=1 Tax=Labrenzia sp. R5_0 TaxID=2821108 RepID=UPI001ADCB1FA|nr:hypothetical protein [Labrenzia sp. R5_0]MBO9457888.1 hypothetical protein [Labrenzia sp. R5_0]